ncbi:MAG: copper amine oxidase N-terminal domain-containing protein [Candidatus Aquilonibacter sp.]
MTYRRPSLRLLILTAVVAMTASAFVAFSRPIDMVVDGEIVASDVPPVATPGNHVYVPVRTLADALGAQTSIEGQNVIVVRGGESVRLSVGDVHATVNGMPLTLEHAPFRVRGRVMIGLRSIARAFGVHASYNARLARIAVMTPGIGEASPAQPAQAQ